MPKQLIHGVTVKKLQIHCDERGRLMEMIRADDRELKQLKFGQVYMTTAYPGVTKAWHYHKKQTDHFVCVRGMMKVVLFRIFHRRAQPASHRNPQPRLSRLQMYLRPRSHGHQFHHRNLRLPKPR